MIRGKLYDLISIDIFNKKPNMRWQTPNTCRELVSTGQTLIPVYDYLPEEQMKLFPEKM